MSLFSKVYNLLTARETPSEQRIRIASQVMSEAKEQALRDLFRPRGQDEDFAKLQWFSEEQIIDLSTAHNNTLIWDGIGRGIYIPSLDDYSGNAKIRFNTKTSAMFPIRLGYVKAAFNKIYLTNPAVASKEFSFVVAYRDFAEYMMIGKHPANLLHVLMNETTPKDLKDIYDVMLSRPGKSSVATLYNVTMTLADTEYSQALLDNTTKFLIHTRDASEFRLAFVTGKVAAPTAPYFTVPPSSDYGESGLQLSSKVLYFASAEAGKVIEIVNWV